VYKLYQSKRNVRLHQQIHIGGTIHNHCIHYRTPFLF